MDKSPSILEEKSGNNVLEPSPSIPSPSYVPFHTIFASVSLHRSDRIRFLGFSPADIDAARGVIQTSFRKGISKEQRYANSHEFKLHGTPWHGQGDDAITSRVLIRELLAHLFRSGWILHASTDVSKKEADKDTLLFRKQQRTPSASNWIAMSFNQNDRLRLIGADSTLRDAMRTTLQNNKLLQSDQGWKNQALGAYEFKLNGYPWCASGEATMTTRFLLLKMLECLEDQGWSVYATVDQSTGCESYSENDSWYCVKDRNWVPGMAVYHR